MDSLLQNYNSDDEDSAPERVIAGGKPNLWFDLRSVGNKTQGESAPVVSLFTFSLNKKKSGLGVALLP